MKIEIDQSGRTEYTSVNTSVGDSLGNNVLIKAKDKRLIQLLFRRAGKPRLFVIQTFSLLICLLIKKSFNKNNIYVIDIEYPGHNNNILNYVTRFSPKLRIFVKKSQIRFSLIGKKSKAHKIAYKFFKKSTKSGFIRNSEILKVLLP
ncbi:MAG: hypothetical protein D4R68_07830 [Ignavibacteriales bacterium]|nr:MAG: hypothetical protein D4R68_07830 [Ignavibacteriales bacterium]